MARRGNRRCRPPGVYQDPDGYTTTISILEDGRRQEVRVSAGPRPVRTKTVMSQESFERPEGQNLRRMCQTGHAPAVRTNPIPGEPSRVKRDDVTGEVFETRTQYDTYLREKGLVECGKGDIPKAPSNATKRIRRRGETTYGAVRGANLRGESDADIACEDAPRSREQLRAVSDRLLGAGDKQKRRRRLSDAARIRRGG